RVLILPIWEKASNTVYDMLVGHEVGHALFTPNQDPPEDIPHSFINVVEDARIEKLIKRRYMGLAKTFYRAYNELNEEDFFEIDGQDLDSFNLADRANLHFKIGSFLNISFTTREKEIINLIDSCQTFEDVISASRVLYEYCKEQQEDQQNCTGAGACHGESPLIQGVHSPSANSRYFNGYLEIHFPRYQKLYNL
ncbi:MAG: hypothetical protein MK239_05665, partial [Gemmatimonadetes bacterium]|nr:hypothetical protein [Gemmatimonadota bacterium]